MKKDLDDGGRGVTGRTHISVSLVNRSTGRNNVNNGNYRKD